MCMFACINEWTITEEDKNCHISCSHQIAAWLKHKKGLRFSLDTEYIYISISNTVLCNTDIKIFGHITQMVDRG